MNTLHWRRARLFLVVAAGLTVVLGSSCVEDQENGILARKYVVFPAARFVAGQDRDPYYPLCPPDYPLLCGEVCCGEAFPFACPAQSRCYAEQPDADCPDAWVACMPQDVLITGVEPSAVGLRYGESARIAVSFRRWNDAPLSRLIIAVGGVDGEFEQDLTQEQIDAGRVETVVRIMDHAPSLDSCEQACSRSGACGPCYVATNLPGWLVQFMLATSDGTSTGTRLEWLQLSWKDSGGINDQCNDGSDCCTTNPDCGGGIPCQVTGITTPETCECPPGTTYQGTDVHYHVKQCSCDACSTL